MKFWRLTLECGHLRLSGPWNDDEPDNKHMIGDITWCDVCPFMPDAIERRDVMRLRQVVNVESVPAGQFREPETEVHRARMDQIHG